MLTALTLGLVVGLILALTGAGGGILAVPLLVFGIPMGVAQAGPIGLLAVGMAAAAGALLGLRDGIVRYRAALLIAAAGMLLSPVGLWLAHRIDNRWLSILFAVVLLLVAVRTWRHARHPPAPALACANLYPCQRSADTGRFNWTSGCARALALSGTGAGLLSGLLGVGGGFVMAPSQVPPRYPRPSVTKFTSTICRLAVIRRTISLTVQTRCWAGCCGLSTGTTSGPTSRN